MVQQKINIIYNTASIHWKWKSHALFTILDHTIHILLILSAAKPRHGKISVIQNNAEKYTWFTISDVTFIDSLPFIMLSIEKLRKNLTDDKLKETLRYLKSDYGGMFKFYLSICFDFINVFFVDYILNINTVARMKPFSIWLCLYDSALIYYEIL